MRSCYKTGGLLDHVGPLLAAAICCHLVSQPNLGDSFLATLFQFSLESWSVTAEMCPTFVFSSPQFEAEGFDKIVRIKHGS